MTEARFFSADAPAGRAENLSARNLELLRRYHIDGCTRARNELIEINMGLVSKMARKYLGTGLEFDDLKQEGVKGLIRAVDKYDLTYEVELSTYACRWIANFIENEVSRNATTAKVPERTRKLVNKLKNRERKLINEGMSPGCIAEALSQETGLDTQKVESLLAIRGYDVQLDSDAYRGEEGETLLDRMAGTDNFEERVIVEDQIKKLKDLISKLPKQRRLAIEHYHGLNGAESESFKEVAEILGVSRQRANVLYRDGIAQIHEMIGATDRIRGH